MPRDGALTISDVHLTSLSVVCRPCDRFAYYNMAWLMRQHGDAKLTDLLPMLVDCPKASAGVHDPCKAVYSELCFNA